MNISFSWEIILGQRNIVIEESIESFKVQEDDNYESSKMHDYFVHRLLTDVHYLTNLRLYYQEHEGKLKNSLDSLNLRYDYISSFFDNIATAFKPLIQYVDFSDNLANLNLYINLRDILKKVLLIKDKHGKIKRRLNRNIKSQKLSANQLEYRVGQLVKAVEDTQKILFDNNIDVLADNFIDAANLYRVLKKRYIKGGSCFSITDANIANQKEVIYTLSGIKPYNWKELDAAMAKIVTPTQVYVGFKEEDINDVPYLKIDGRIVTYSMACDSGVIFNDRMFSCCERKTIAYLQREHNDVDAFQMYVKYTPCEFCAEIASRYMIMWNGEIKTGKGENFDKFHLCEDKRRIYEQTANKILP